MVLAALIITLGEQYKKKKNPGVIIIIQILSRWEKGQ